MKYDVIQKSAEEILRMSERLSPQETLYDFLARPYESISQAITEPTLYFDIYRRLPFIKIIWSVAISDLMHYISSSSQSSVVKFNANALSDDLKINVVKDLTPYVFNFLKWDLDRRNFRHEEDRRNYLNHTIVTLEQEMNGEKVEIANKYIALLIDFIISHVDKFLKSATDEDLAYYEFDREEITRNRNALKQLIGDQIEEFIDPEMQSMFMDIYKPKVKQFFEGIFISTHRFDYIINAFIEAQNDYKNYILKTQLNVSQSKLNSILMALQNRNTQQFVSIVHAMFASIPNQLIKQTNLEAYYHTNMHMMLKALESDVISELSVNNGRMDTVIEFNDVIYILEYKINASSQVAMDQIMGRKYYESFLTKQKDIILLGISFNTANRNIDLNFREETIPKTTFLN